MTCISSLPCTNDENPQKNCTAEIQDKALSLEVQTKSRKLLTECSFLDKENMMHQPNEFHRKN